MDDSEFASLLPATTSIWKSSNKVNECAEGQERGGGGKEYERAVIKKIVKPLVPAQLTPKQKKERMEKLKQLKNTTENQMNILKPKQKPLS